MVTPRILNLGIRWRWSILRSSANSLHWIRGWVGNMPVWVMCRNENRVIQVFWDRKLCRVSGCRRFERSQVTVATGTSWPSKTTELCYFETSSLTQPQASHPRRLDSSTTPLWKPQIRKKKSLTAVGNRTPFLGLPASSLITIPTELPRFVQAFTTPDKLSSLLKRTGKLLIWTTNVKKTPRNISCTCFRKLMPLTR
jgi:hypothetical protein